MGQDLVRLPAKECRNLQLILFMDCLVLRRQATMIVKLTATRSIKLRIAGVQAASLRSHLPELGFARLFRNDRTRWFFDLTGQAASEALE